MRKLALVIVDEDFSPVLDLIRSLIVETDAGISEEESEIIVADNGVPVKLDMDKVNDGSLVGNISAVGTKVITSRFDTVIVCATREFISNKVAINTFMNKMTSLINALVIITPRDANAHESVQPALERIVSIFKTDVTKHDPIADINVPILEYGVLDVDELEEPARNEPEADVVESELEVPPPEEDPHHNDVNDLVTVDAEGDLIPLPNMNVIGMWLVNEELRITLSISRSEIAKILKHEHN